MNLSLHYRSSTNAAIELQNRLEACRSHSVQLIQGDLLEPSVPANLVEQTLQQWGRLDLLVNNASAFYPTPVDTATPAQWDELMGANLKAPFFLAQAAAPQLRQNRGCLINMIDIYAQRPLAEHPIYCIAKAGLAMLTQALARELGSEVRVNGIAPGPILWPEDDLSEQRKTQILAQTVLGHSGTPQNIAQTLLFLVRDGAYITGQIVVVDGGRSIFI